MGLVAEGMVAPGIQAGVDVAVVFVGKDAMGQGDSQQQGPQDF